MSFGSRTPIGAVEEDRRVHSLLAEFEVVPIYRDLMPKFAGTSYHVHPVVRTYRIPLNTWRTPFVLLLGKIENFSWPAWVTPGSADVRLCWSEVFLNNLPAVIVDFPKGYDLEYYLKGLIFLGFPHDFPLGVEV